MLWKNICIFQIEGGITIQTDFWIQEANQIIILFNELWTIEQPNLTVDRWIRTFSGYRDEFSRLRKFQQYLNERDTERLLSISKAFTEKLQKYVHQFQIDHEGRDKDVYLYNLKEIVCCSALSKSEIKKSFVSLISRYLYSLFLAIVKPGTEVSSLSLRSKWSAVDNTTSRNTTVLLLI